jgi:hypothetical protein
VPCFLQPRDLADDEDAEDRGDDLEDVPLDIELWSASSSSPTDLARPRLRAAIAAHADPTT